MKSDEWTSSIENYDIDFNNIFIQLLRRKIMLKNRFDSDFGIFWDNISPMRFKIRTIDY